ncbi:MAG: hypothetical protein AAF593_12840 [Planctomycetota bacterium]
MDNPPEVGSFAKIASRLIFEVSGYNPPVQLQPEWRIVGPYSAEIVVNQLKRGLETDDDIITQWFHGDDVLELVKAARDFTEMVHAIQCIQGAFEVHDEARQYVVRVLGQEWA